MTMLGMNAVLKATRLGQSGKGLNVIALELRSYALQVVGGIKEMKPGIDEVMTIIRQLSEAGQTQKAAQMMRIKDRMASAIKTFRVSAKHMQEASTELEKAADEVGRLLNQAVLQLDSRHQIRETLLKAAASIDDFAAVINDGSQLDERCTAYIDDMLCDSYTMECERDTHDDVIYHSAKRKNLKLPMIQTEKPIEVGEFLF
jgi:methyl-accepting chemotaxis protein